MKEKYIVFDTNYINKILKDYDLYKNILKDLSSKYRFSINIVTFIEIINQKINNDKIFNFLIEFLITNEVYVGEFRGIKFTDDSKINYYKFRNKTKAERKKYFSKIKDRYNDFISELTVNYLIWILYAMELLLTQKIRDEDYKKYLLRRFERYKRMFSNAFASKKIRIKDRFEEILYEEIKRLKNNNTNIDVNQINQILELYKSKKIKMIEIFRASNKEEEKIKKDFIDYFFKNEVQPFLKIFANQVFIKYMEKLFLKMIDRCGKMDPNDLADALILSNINTDEYVLLTNDEKIIKFLKLENLFDEDLYNTFNKNSEIKILE